MDFYRFTSIYIDSNGFVMDLGGSGARMFSSLCRPVAACGSLWQRIGSPIRNISGGLEEVADRWEEGIGRTEDIEDLLEGLRT